VLFWPVLVVQLGMILMTCDGRDYGRHMEKDPNSPILYGTHMRCCRVYYLRRKRCSEREGVIVALRVPELMNLGRSSNWNAQTHMQIQMKMFHLRPIYLLRAIVAGLMPGFIVRVQRAVAVSLDSDGQSWSGRTNRHCHRCLPDLPCISLCPFWS